ncbi:hypothetical protein K492DRAFT_176180 [Lichtheimia hyalospora FSU 10163]|nr:hypothetical protein K492DRAFT_176180 [Lichtheimia hyalospora FSU 10163]
MYGLNGSSTRSMAWRSSWLGQRIELSNMAKVQDGFCSVILYWLHVKGVIVSICIA